MAVDPPRISDNDYLAAYPVLAVWGVAYAVFTPSLFDEPLLDLSLSVSMLVLAVCAVTCWVGVLVKATLTVERVVLWGVLLILGFYVLLTALAAGYFVAHGNTDRIALVPFSVVMVILVNRRRRWLQKQRLQVSLIARAHPEVR